MVARPRHRDRAATERSRRQLAAKEDSKQLYRNRLSEFEQPSRKIRNAGTSRDVLMDLLRDKRPQPEELETALAGFNDATQSLSGGPVLSEIG